MLNSDKVEKWHADGFIKLEGFFDGKTRDAISDTVDEIAKWDVSADKWMMWFEKTKDNRKIVSKVENFLEYHDRLRELVLADQRIKDCVEQLLDEKTKMLKELLIFKYPDSGGYRPHQDIYHIPHKLPDRMVHAVVSIAIDDSEPENGGLFFSAGNHKKDVFKMDAGGVIDPEIAKTFSWEPVHCKAGDIFIFDDYAPHYSEPNKSDRSRRTLYLVFQRESTAGPNRTEYNAMKRAYNPPEEKDYDINDLRPSNGIFYRD
ncbi:phytanoyl-CoA dioxygenase family protein [Collimonas pratensis]|uniref:2OG-Fe(II) oxygenase superfamily protein n=1 Tax=Collimonas pratensis TaxID=279113 RepID=A0A127PYL5_9BURK|nr:phytanoyl-CoA dioxygenase family protein [Collimonas pratensis]AMP02685.1 2OG-Fe(II) oxygenase superfamily protein [Collimonas pratensis]AMP12576.1 2OG-Fe(II) oxygenase superfamily protein [Collimonas pratensis]NKI71116.1 phytanoyl-CoA dioxygenase family protein [Collimonas pratensis]